MNILMIKWLLGMNTYVIISIILGGMLFYIEKHPGKFGLFFLALIMFNTSMGYAWERVVDDEVLLKLDECSKDRLWYRLNKGEVVVNKSVLDVMKECKKEEERKKEREEFFLKNKG